MPDRALARFVLATANAHKARELAEILGDDVVLLPRPPDVAEVDETASTLEGNARLKAQALVAATGEAAIADDTGLEVDALGGRPGVHSARYAGSDSDAVANVAKLLDELRAADAASPAERAARFRTVIVALWPDGREVVVEGVVDGSIAEQPRGAGGFGYDPVFVPDGDGGLTFAELSAEAKHAISHRGRAARALAAELAVPAGRPPEHP
ncbi:MAG TPA: RdgB/HAM1 family non-canonical purine NTP pyrophosphatase [Acidimicrobiales bacterium]|jgi:XTP/dITP diphosphohydrolase|nr:RdgB/HAM1 family non-canonical purine NTP pyrophosphatase [Acidimicrobiales bacterium]